MKLTKGDHYLYGSLLLWQPLIVLFIMEFEKSSVTALAPMRGPTASGGALVNRAVVALIACLVLLPIILAVYNNIWNQSSDGDLVDLATSDSCSATVVASRSFNNSSVTLKDRLLGGLLASGFDESSCYSRYNMVNYRKPSSYTPSEYLIQRLRKYEALHKKCGPSTELYKKSIEQLKSNQSGNLAECKYIVWFNSAGLGNRFLTITSTFIYALLTNRVLLIEKKSDMGALFCEPFPGTSWLLPDDFPYNPVFSDRFKQRFGDMLRDRKLNKDAADRQWVPAFVYLHMDHDYTIHDKRFFCGEDQLILSRIPWLVIRSNNYFAVSLFQMPGYADELNKMFPNKNTVFHHIGRYLFHPTNKVWGLITRYYNRYLAKADTILGIQVRVFDKQKAQNLGLQILACTSEEKLLPKIAKSEDHFTQSKNNTERSIAVLVTSLSSEYYDRIQKIYWEHSTVNGETVSVFQPSHEESQKEGMVTHEQKALPEIYLLSMTGELITSAMSTFGYAAQGLGNMKPWILEKPERDRVSDPPCRKAMSIEPCYHAPPHYDCKSGKVDTTVPLAPYIRRCEDVDLGLKLVDREDR